MRKKTLRTLLLVAITILGGLTAASKTTVKEAKAMPYSLFLQEYQQYYPDVLAEIKSANTTRVALQSYGVVSPSLAKWNNSMLSLIFWLQEIDRELKALPYTPFSMDKLLFKFDIALSYGVQAAKASDAIYFDTMKLVQPPNCNPPSNSCLTAVGLAGLLSSQTHTIKEKVVALGFLFAKAKLEMLELPRLQCFPLRVQVGANIDCMGQSINGTATLVFNNTQTKQITQVPPTQTDAVDAFIWFEAKAPSTPGRYQAILTDSGANTVSSFFDVFVSVPTILEPTTIIPISVLIAAVATLAVASRRVRRPV